MFSNSQQPFPSQVFNETCTYELIKIQRKLNKDPLTHTHMSLRPFCLFVCFNKVVLSCLCFPPFSGLVDQHPFPLHSPSSLTCPGLQEDLAQCTFPSAQHPRGQISLLPSDSHHFLAQRQPMSLTLLSHQALLRSSRGLACPSKLDPDPQLEVGVLTQLSLLSQPHHRHPPSTQV